MKNKKNRLLDSSKDASVLGSNNQAPIEHNDVQLDFDGNKTGGTSFNVNNALNAIKNAQHKKSESSKKKMLENDDELGSFNIDADQLKIDDDQDLNQYKMAEQNEIKSLLKSTLQKSMFKVKEGLNKKKVDEGSEDKLLAPKDEKEREKDIEDEKERQKKEREEKKQAIIDTAKEFLKQYTDFMCGMVFFSYDIKSFSVYQKDFVPDGKKVKSSESLVQKVKKYLQIIIVISVLYSILSSYQKKLGFEKSQSMEFVGLSNITYNITKLPQLLPMHQFGFFETSEIEDRIKCRKYFDETECKKIEQKRCQAKGLTTIAYETCMIRLNNILNQNTTQFCTNHYNKLELWTENLSPDKANYYERMHNCYLLSGVEKGRRYCQDIRDHSEGWTRQNLWNCYTKNKVDFAKEKCDALFEGANDMQGLLQCYGTQGVERG